MAIVIDYNASKYLTSMYSGPRPHPDLFVEDQQVFNVLYGPKGEALIYEVDRVKLPIGYQQEPK